MHYGVTYDKLSSQKILPFSLDQLHLNHLLSLRPMQNILSSSKCKGWWTEKTENSSALSGWLSPHAVWRSEREQQSSLRGNGCRDWVRESAPSQTRVSASLSNFLSLCWVVILAHFTGTFGFVSLNSKEYFQSFKKANNQTWMFSRLLLSSAIEMNSLAK